MFSHISATEICINLKRKGANNSVNIYLYIECFYFDEEKYAHTFVCLYMHLYQNKYFLNKYNDFYHTLCFRVDKYVTQLASQIYLFF